MKKFSILLPCYNGGKFLEQAINSILSQDYKNLELIIVDGKSTDNSHKIISKYCKLDKRIKWFKYNDKGVPDALNYALNFVQGDIVGFLASDDYYAKGIFVKIINFLNYQKNFSWVYGNSYNVYLDNRPKLLIRPGQFSYNALFLGNFVGLENVFFDKDILMSYKFDNNNKYSPDYELWFRLSRKHKPLYIDEVISYDIHDGNNISSLFFREQKSEAYNIAKKNAKTIFQKLLVLSHKFPYIRSILFRFYKL